MLQHRQQKQHTIIIMFVNEWRYNRPTSVLLLLLATLEFLSQWAKDAKWNELSVDSSHCRAATCLSLDGHLIDKMINQKIKYRLLSVQCGNSRNFTKRLFTVKDGLNNSHLWSSEFSRFCRIGPKPKCHADVYVKTPEHCVPVCIVYLYYTVHLLS